MNPSVIIIFTVNFYLCCRIIFIKNISIVCEEIWLVIILQNELKSILWKYNFGPVERRSSPWNGSVRSSSIILSVVWCSTVNILYRCWLVASGPLVYNAILATQLKGRFDSCLSKNCLKIVFIGSRLNVIGKRCFHNKLKTYSIYALNIDNIYYRPDYNKPHDIACVYGLNVY